LAFFFIWKFLFCLSVGMRIFCAESVESTQPMSSFFYKIAMLALVSKIGTTNRRLQMEWRRYLPTKLMEP
jgi:hypothetical protein